MSGGKVIVAGGSGFVGGHLLARLKESGYTTVVLSRSSKRVENADQMQAWDGKTVGSWAMSLEGARAVINLSGPTLQRKWTPEVKQDILRGRVEPTKAIGQAIKDSQDPPKVWINASAVGYYGETSDRAVGESAPPGKGFLAEVGQQWEAAQKDFALSDTRMVQARLGVLLGKDGGAYPKLESLTKAFLGGAVGSGEQWMSWIHIDDAVRMLEWMIETDVVGPVNVVAPNPARNKDVMAALRQALGRPPIPPAPEFMVKLGSSLMGVEPDMILDSHRVRPVIAEGRGFDFCCRDITDAIDDLAETTPEAWKG